MKNIGIVANLNKRGAKDQAKKIAARLEKRGIAVVFEQLLADALSLPEKGFLLEKFRGKLDALIVLGGDGTLISTFRRLGRRNIPLLGINLGGLGFLTEFRLTDIPKVLQDLSGGKLRVEKRMTLGCTGLRKGKALKAFTAINDIVIGKGCLARVIQMEALVDGEYLTSYMADGIIVATPTGSTAYSLSAQGPIVSPRTDTILLNPICPHTLTNRPIILSGRRMIEIRLLSAPDDTALTVDGQTGLSLQCGDVVKISRGKKALKLFTRPDSTYFHILRSKLHWGGRSHYKK